MRTHVTIECKHIRNSPRVQPSWALSCLSASSNLEGRSPCLVSLCGSSSVWALLFPWPDFMADGTFFHKFPMKKKKGIKLIKKGKF